MSVVAVKVYDKEIIMSADSIIIHGEADKTPIGNGKIFEVNNMLIGFSGAAGEGVLFTLFAETHAPSEATERAMVEFLMEFNDWRGSKGFGRGKPIENSYLIAFKDKCFYMGGDYVAEVKDYFAIGYGHKYSEAALYLGHSPAEAVRVACELCCYVAEPIVTKSLPRK